MTKVTTHQAEDDARNEGILIYVNGEIVPKAQATVSVYDSGFMLGDGVWEGLRLYNGKWAFIDEHLDRLIEAAKAIDLNIGLTQEQVKNCNRAPSTWSADDARPQAEQPFQAELYPCLHRR